MTDTGRLAQFERRYAAAPASPLAFLQLAEEYRRAGRFADAIRVLEPGLKEHPTYLSAQLALGRTRLEMGDGAAAAEILSEVLAKDPSHLLAYKLLAEARLRSGDPVAARQTLDRYRLLNDGDPEIADLDRRIDELGGGRPAPVAAEEAPPDDGEAPIAAPPPARSTDDLFVGAAGDGDGPLAAPVAIGEPFATLDSAGDRARYLAGLAAGGIFDLPAAAVPAAPVESVELAPNAPPEPDQTAEENPATVTLGQLYLEQLHFAEAQRTFRSVLERDPGNAAALLGLAEVERSLPRPFTAHDLLRWWQSGAGAEAGRRPRRASLLEAYLSRIRGRSRTDVS